MTDQCKSVLISATLWIASGTLARTATAEDLQVNTYTTSFQQRPAVAMDADGDFVIVWSSDGSSGTDTSSSSIQGQRYTSGGSPVDGEFQVNTYTTSSQRHPSVSRGVDGNFVVAWQSFGSGDTDSSLFSIQMQRVASNGLPVGGELQVNTYTTGGQFFPSVAVDADGDFVVVWESNGSPGTDTDSFSIQGRRYAPDGTPAGGDFQVNTYTMGFQGFPAVEFQSDGGFVVVWESERGPGTDALVAILGQRFASDGTSVGREFQVNTYVTGRQLYPAVAVDREGDFVVVWQSSRSGGSDSSEESIQGQRYASDGTPVGGEFQVNTYTTSYQRYPSLASQADGDFVVVWESDGSGGTDSSENSIQGQRYTSDGSVVGGEFQVNTFTVRDQRHPAVAIDDAGGFVAVWQSGLSAGTDNDESVQRSVQPLFVDGFESGDTSAWSSAAQ